MTKEELEKELEALEHTPLFDNIIVKEQRIEKTAGGLYIPDEAQAESMRVTEGVVMAVGSEVSVVMIGDRVSYGLYAGKKMKIPAEDGYYWVMNVTDLQTKIGKDSGHIILTKDMYNKLTEGDGDDGSSE